MLEKFTANNGAREARNKFLLDKYRPSLKIPAVSPLVSVVILNFNGEAILQNCLESSLNQSYSNFEVIILDNGSKDRSANIIHSFIDSLPEREKSRVKLIFNQKNLGVGSGRNLAISYAKGEILAFIDNDGYPHQDWLKNCVQTLQEDLTIGAVASNVFFANKPEIENGTGGKIDCNCNGQDINYGIYYADAKYPLYVLYPMGCGMVISKATLDSLGPFNPLHSRWYDDVELGIKLRALGKKVRLCPTAIIDHDVGSSTPHVSNKAWYISFLYHRSRLNLVFTYYSSDELKTFFKEELLCLFRMPKTKSSKEIPVILFAHLSALFHTSFSLRKRFRRQPGNGLIWEDYE